MAIIGKKLILTAALGAGLLAAAAPASATVILRGSLSSGSGSSGGFNYKVLPTTIQLPKDGQSDSVAASVPEPASWLTMLAGFGLLGAATRRRAKVQAAH